MIAAIRRHRKEKALTTIATMTYNHYQAHDVGQPGTGMFLSLCCHFHGELFVSCAHLPRCTFVRGLTFALASWVEFTAALMYTQPNAHAHTHAQTHTHTHTHTHTNTLTHSLTNSLILKKASCTGEHQLHGKRTRTIDCARCKVNICYKVRVTLTIDETAFDNGQLT